MSWIVCKQTLQGSIRYFSSETQEIHFKSYEEFLQTIGEKGLIDFSSFKEHLDKFQVLLIDYDTHSWELQGEDFIKIKKNATFEELVKINEERIKKDNREIKQDSRLDRIKKYINLQSKIKTDVRQFGKLDLGDFRKR